MDVRLRIEEKRMEKHRRLDKSYRIVLSQDEQDGFERGNWNEKKTTVTNLVK
jgi:hypothetical protein